MSTSSEPPEFVQGDSGKAFIVKLRDSDGALMNLSAGSCRLFAVGVDSGDKPTSNPGEGAWAGVAGTYPNGTGTDGTVSFGAIGAKCAIGTGRRADVYHYWVEYTVGVDKTIVDRHKRFLVFARGA